MRLTEREVSVSEVTTSLVDSRGLGLASKWFTKVLKVVIISIVCLLSDFLHDFPLRLRESLMLVISINLPQSVFEVLVL